MQDIEQNNITPALHQIPYRYGGSFAAYFKGGAKEPMDIDVEVNNPDDVKLAAEALVRSGGKLSRALVPGSINAMVWFKSTFFKGNKIACDIVDENNMVFNKYRKSPAEMEEPIIGQGDSVSSIRLILNCLDREIMTSLRVHKSFTKEDKKDAQQIKSLYQALSIPGVADKREFMVSYITSALRIEGDQGKYISRFLEIVDSKDTQSTKNPGSELLDFEFNVDWEKINWDLTEFEPFGTGSFPPVSN